MADKKISQLPAATTPLAGTEVLPIVQSGTTDQVSIANITAGRVPAMNNAAMGYTAVTSAAGTTTLTATSNHIQRLTGSAAQTYKLPDATTMTAGTAFLFDNDSTGLLTVVDNASGAVTTVPSNSIQYVYLMTNATAAGTWGKYSWTYGGGALSITAAKTASITNSLTLSGTDSTTMTFPATSATIARTDAANSFTGDQTLTTGNLVIGTSGKGIDFSATAGTGTSELLADYEEGNWTVTATPTTSGTITLSSATGAYTKIGNKVFVSGRLIVGSVSSPVGGEVRISLPIAVTSGAANAAAGTVTYYDSSATAYLSPIATATPDGGTYVRVFKAANEFDANDQITFELFYYA